MITELWAIGEKAFLFDWALGSRECRICFVLVLVLMLSDIMH